MHAYIHTYNLHTYMHIKTHTYIHTLQLCDVRNPRQSDTHTDI